jgi:hypothetical protein
MTRRDRMERRLERREEWAGKARGRSDAAFRTAAERAAAIPFGQPILVGHHSERRDRRYRGRIHAGMDRGLQEHQKAEHHAAKASGIAIALERSIFDDDPDAIERLEAKMQRLEDNCTTGKRVNALWRKGGATAVAAEFGEALAAAVAKTMAECRWLRSPCTMSNDRAEIRRCKERLERIRAQRQKADAAEAAGGVKLDRYVESNWCRVTFAEKPERDVLAALRAAGYRWGQGSWQGRLSQLPSYVAELVKAAAGECLCDESHECLPCEDERQGG